MSIIVPVQPLRPSARVGIVCGGFVIAFGLAWLAVDVSQRFAPDPDEQASSGMYAFGDLLLGVAVFGVLALAPLALGLHWLRSVARAWPILAWSAVIYAMTGPLAVIASGGWRESAGNLALLADARCGIMPLSALVLLTVGLFAPKPRWRWMLLGSALLDGAIFGVIVFVKFALPRFVA